MSTPPLAALSVQAPNPQLVDPLAQQQKIMSFKAAMQQQQGAQLGLEEKQQTLARAKAVRDAISKAGGIREALPEIAKLDPDAALDYGKQLKEWDNADLTTKKSKLDLHGKQMERLGQIAGTITDQASQDAALDLAKGEGLIDDATYQQYKGSPFNPEQAKAWQQGALTAKDQIEAHAKQLDAEEKKRVNDAQIEHDKKMELTPDQKEMESEYKDYLEANGLKPNARLKIQFTQKWRKEQADLKRTDPTSFKEWELAGKPIPYAEWVQQRNMRSIEGDESIIEAVKNNPGILPNLTNETRKRIEPRLAKEGFADFSKPLSESAMGKMAESRSAIASLKDLRQVLQDNEQYIGPLSGLQALNPYSDARKAQAKIDLVKQRVGKALEGGVLRKEDEEKYNRILSTLRDEPSTAISKVDGIIDTLTRDLEIYENQQKAGGRRVEEPEPPKSTQKGAGKTLTKADITKAAKDHGQTYEAVKAQAESQGYKIDESK